MLDLLRTFLRPYGRWLTLVVVLLLLQAIGNLYLPSLNADIINNGVLKGDIGYITRIGLLMLVVALAVGALSIVGVYFAARTSMSFGRDVRASIFRQVETFSLAEMNRFGAPSLITRNTNDVQQVQMLVFMGMTMMVSAPLIMIGGVIMALQENARLSLLIAVVVPVMAIVIGLMVSRAIPLFRSLQGKIDRVNKVLRENLTGIRVIRAFVRTRHEEQRFDEANLDLTDTTLRVTRLFALMMPALMLILNLTTVAVIWFGGHLVNDGSMPIGNLTAFLSYIMQILFSVMMAVMMIVMIPRAAASAERIRAVLDTTAAIRDPQAMDATPAMPRRQTGLLVEFDDVEFRYPGAEDPVLSHVTFALQRGQITAVVGSTGSGKTTLTNLIPRLYDVTAGSVHIDGVDIRDLPLEDLWSRIGLVPQKAFLFSGTIESNVRFGKSDASDEEVWKALTTAQAADFVRELPEGLQAPVDQGGANFSGGQRQRLAIARALVRHPDVYLFDDSFSALDYATDARLRIALREQTRDAAVLIVAQRVSTILHADQIIVLDSGAVVGIGTHAELIHACPTYAEIVASQLGAESVA